MVMLMHLALPTGALLKGIPPNLSAEMFFALARMGHGDEIVFGDANFPARYYQLRHRELVCLTIHSYGLILSQTLF